MKRTFVKNFLHYREFLNEDGEVAAQIRPEDVGLLMAGLIILFAGLGTLIMSGICVPSLVQASECLSAPLLVENGSRIESRIICQGESIVTLTRSLFRRGFVMGTIENVDPQHNTFGVSVEGRGRLSMNFSASLRDIKTSYASNQEGTVSVGDQVRYIDEDFPYSRISLRELMNRLKNMENPQWQTGTVERIFRNPYQRNANNTGAEEDAPLYLVRTSNGHLKWIHITDRTTYLVQGFAVFAGRQIDTTGRADIDFGSIAMTASGEDFVSRCQQICNSTEGCQAYTVVIDNSLENIIFNQVTNSLRGQCQLKRFYVLPHGQPVNLNFNRMTWIYGNNAVTGIRVLNPY